MVNTTKQLISFLPSTYIKKISLAKKVHFVFDFWEYHKFLYTFLQVS